MANPAAESKRLQVINRIVSVLQGILAGSDFWYTPGEVAKRFKHWSECTKFPTYMVFSSSGGEIAYAGEMQYDETFYVSVKGIVQDNLDTVTKLERSIRDIRKAINDDSISPNAGTLGALAVQVRIDEPPETDDGYLSLEGFGFFDQKIRCVISGDFGEL
jgi:hypothetical protein